MASSQTPAPMTFHTLMRHVDGTYTVRTYRDTPGSWALVREVPAPTRATAQAAMSEPVLSSPASA